MNRTSTFVVTVLLSLLAQVGGGLAQERPHAEPEQARHAGRYAPPAPGGRFAGPYGYAYPAGAYPAYPPPQPYPQGPTYPGGPYGAPPPQRRLNSLGSDWRLQQEEARAGVRHGQFAPLGQIIESIARRSPGRQLDAGIEYDGGRAIYRVRWITVHGRRIDFLVDAASGAILGER